jgi:NET1-associated nuclear protein 1 (U3 small nucleolar RNA-associated protein 17)
VLRLALTPSSEADRRPQHVGKLSNTPSSLIISPKFTYLVALSNNKAHTYRLPTAIHHETWKPACVKFVSDQNFTCGAFAPERVIAGRSDEEWFATGDVKGVIRLWHGLTAAFRQIDAAAAAQSGVVDFEKVHPETEKRLPTTSLHWHAHAVGAIAFTPSGAQLLSVGEESVLVQWHLASGKKEYIPRLGGRPIISLAVKAGSRGIEEEYWMKLVDGGVVRVGAASGQVSTIGQSVRLGEHISVSM